MMDETKCLGCAADAGCMVRHRTGRGARSASVVAPLVRRLANPSRCGFWLTCVAAVACGSLQADDQPAEASAKGTRWAVIVVGLPGDNDHAERFREVVAAWRTWLVQALEFEPDHVLVLDGKQGAEAQPATRGTMQETLVKLGGELRELDSLWVFFLGHANYDGSRAFFHVAGPDPDSVMIAKWLGGVKCHEQVVWLTNSCAGWFVKPLAKPGRIVIAATAADFEFNATEFPYALASVTKKPVAELDSNHDQRVSVLELFAAVANETEQIFQADRRVPTEHAQLDDDGDGQGAELPDLLKAAAENASTATSDFAGKKDTPTAKTSTKPKITDGQLVARTFVPYRSANPPSSTTTTTTQPPQTKQKP